MTCDAVRLMNKFAHAFESFPGHRFFYQSVIATGECTASQCLAISSRRQIQTADPDGVICLYVVEKVCQRPGARRVAADPAMQADTHHFRMLFAFQPELIEGILQ